jgi:putative transcriptional regulator
VSGDSLKSKLLIATPPLVDPNFDRSVVFLIEHTDQGALGVVLNRPGDATLRGALGRWEDVVSPPAVTFIGGPVQHEVVVALAQVNDPASDDDGFTTIVHDLATVDLAEDPLLLAGGVRTLRIFAGYSGWGPRQLETELAQDAWVVVDGRTDDVFSTNPSDLWRTVLRRQRGETRWMALYPDDVSAN